MGVSSNSERLSRKEVAEMENQNQDPQNQQQKPGPTRAQKLDRLYNRMLICLGIGVIALAVYQYVLVPLLG